MILEHHRSVATLAPSITEPLRAKGNPRVSFQFRETGCKPALRVDGDFGSGAASARSVLTELLALFFVRPLAARTPPDALSPSGRRQVFEKSWWTWTGSNRRPLPCRLRNINHFQTLLAKTKASRLRIWTPFRRHGAPFPALDSVRTPEPGAGTPRSRSSVAVRTTVHIIQPQGVAAAFAPLGGINMSMCFVVGKENLRAELPPRHPV
jgi:hypothetical protein